MQLWGQITELLGGIFSGFFYKKVLDQTGDLNHRKVREHEIQFRLGEILLNYAELHLYLDKHLSLDAGNEKGTCCSYLHTAIDED